MRLYPAIDLRAGRCVRLTQGDFDRETTYDADPVARAREFTAQGAEWLHVVDLDAARTGQLHNRAVVAAIAEAVPAPVQVGGGVRSVEAAEVLFEAGVARVVVGTAAVEQPDLVEAIVRRGGEVAVGLDVRGREVATHGWEAASGLDLAPALGRFAHSGAAAVVITQIERDGMLGGADLHGLEAAVAMTELPVIASGGVGTVHDLAALDRLEVDGRRLHGAIVGKALHDGRFTVREALDTLGGGDGAT